MVEVVAATGEEEEVAILGGGQSMVDILVDILVDNIHWI